MKSSIVVVVVFFLFFVFWDALKKCPHFVVREKNKSKKLALETIPV